MIGYDDGGELTGMKSLERRTEFAPSTTISRIQSSPSLRQALEGGLVILGATECLEAFHMVHSDGRRLCT